MGFSRGIDRRACGRPPARSARPAASTTRSGRYIVVPEEHLPAASSTLDGLTHRRRLRPRRRLQGRARRCSSELGAEVIAFGGQARTAQHQRRLRRDAPGGDAPARCASTGRTSGIALDGDADRVHLVDEHGGMVDGDAYPGHLRHPTMLAPGARWRKKTVVATVMSNIGLDARIRRAGGQVVRTAVGDRYVVEEMRRRRLQPRRRAVRAT